MKILTLPLIVLFSTVASLFGFDIEYYDLNKAPAMFKMFVTDYNKVYKDIIDLLTHYEVFKKNLEAINDYNRLNKGVSRVYMDEYADFTVGELQALLDDQA